MSEPTPHTWVAATEVPVRPAQLERAVGRHKLVVLANTALKVLDVYCLKCRKFYAPERADEECRLGPQHIGGPHDRSDEPTNGRRSLPKESEVNGHAR